MKKNSPTLLSSCCISLSVFELSKPSRPAEAGHYFRYYFGVSFSSLLVGGVFALIVGVPLSVST